MPFVPHSPTVRQLKFVYQPASVPAKIPPKLYHLQFDMENPLHAGEVTPKMRRESQYNVVCMETTQLELYSNQ